MSLNKCFFLTGFLRTLVFREGVSGVPRSADESLGILYDVLIILPNCFYNNIKLWKFVGIDRQSKRCRDINVEKDKLSGTNKKNKKKWNIGK